MIEKEYSLLLIKPDAYERGLVDMILDTFKKDGLEIVYQKKINLTEEMIRAYQPVLNEVDYDGKTDWQHEFINALADHSVDVFLMRGFGATQKTNKIKKEIRHKYVSGDVDRVPNNLLHTTDSYDDLLLNVRTLIPEKLGFVIVQGSDLKGINNIFR